jgi:hypothetical protein
MHLQHPLRTVRRADDPYYQEAQKLVWLLLTKSSVQKVYNGKELLKKLALGAFLSMPENQLDLAPSTLSKQERNRIRTGVRGSRYST